MGFHFYEEKYKAGNGYRRGAGRRLLLKWVFVIFSLVGYEYLSENLTKLFSPPIIVSFFRQYIVQRKYFSALYSVLRVIFRIHLQSWFHILGSVENVIFYSTFLSYLSLRIEMPGEGWL